MQRLGGPLATGCDVLGYLSSPHAFVGPKVLFEKSCFLANAKQVSDVLLSNLVGVMRRWLKWLRGMKERVHT